jgi:D-glycero-alpha-D-manno-heptose-7-phosphate kinase
MRTITALAPIRICDCGGWTDTWFAGHGRVFNIAIRPCAEVRVAVFPFTAARPPVILDVSDYDDRYAPALVPGQWERHPLLEAAVERVGVPAGVSVEIAVSCGVPAGASTGTSAAIAVALVGALERLNGRPMDRRLVARAAHEVETKQLGQQSGIQDQICSAFGGINDITMTTYPDAEVQGLPASGELRRELERRLSVVFLGGGHSSSALHGRVIDRLEGLGPDCPELDVLRRCAAEAARTFAAGDLAGLGRAMTANTEAQRRLHDDLVCADADRVIAVAMAHGAAGWKVNGAGGEGGSLTILGPESPGARRAMLAAIEAESPSFRHLQPTLDTDGLRVLDDAPDTGCP